jgi:hypothetical protein
VTSWRLWSEQKIRAGDRPPTRRRGRQTPCQIEATGGRLEDAGGRKTRDAGGRTSGTDEAGIQAGRPCRRDPGRPTGWDSLGMWATGGTGRDESWRRGTGLATGTGLEVEIGIRGNRAAASTGTGGCRGELAAAIRVTGTLNSVLWYRVRNRQVVFPGGQRPQHIVTCTGENMQKTP